MKKLTALLLVSTLLFSLSACIGKRAPDDSTATSQTQQVMQTDGTESEPETRIPMLTSFDDYESVIDLYKNVIQICFNYEDSKDAHEKYAADLGITDESEKALFGTLLTSAYLFYPGRGAEFPHSPHHKLSCGYAIKDLNGDGIDELIFMTEEGHVTAIFSMENGTPILLDHFIPRGRCWIDGDGRIHFNGSGGADSSINAVYQVASGGGSLELIAEFGLNGHEWVGDTAVTKYYKLEKGEKVSISEDELDALTKQYGAHLGYEQCAAATKEQAGLTFIPLFSNIISEEQAIEIATKYWERYNIKENGYIVVNAYNRTPYSSLHVVVIRWLVENHHYSTFDEIWIDATTGDTIVPYDINGGKG
ncbi:MAG: hypothetical protein IJZ80_00735 [Clostridia bacterium]|nr:hypothetical protein [Clostridia bacterium]